MDCVFTINTDVLKKVLKLTYISLPNFGDSGDGALLFRLNKDKLLVKCGFAGRWLEQAVSVQSSYTAQFAIYPFSLLSIKFPNKQIVFEVSKSLLKLKCGRLKAELKIIATVDEVLKQTPKERVKLEHSFELDAFTKALNLLSFSPLMSEASKTLIKLKSSEGFLFYITNDSYRGGYLKIGSFSSKMDSVIDFTNFMALLPNFQCGENIKLGTSEKQIRLQNKNVDFQFPLQTGTVRNVPETIGTHLKNVPESSFQIKSSELKDAVITVCSLEKDKKKDIKIKIEIKKGKTVANKPVEDKIILSTLIGKNKTDFLLVAYNVDKEGIYYTTSKIISDMLSLDGIVKINFFKNVVIIEGESVDVKYMIPRIEE